MMVKTRLPFLTKFWLTDGTLVIEFEKPRRTISSAARGGGLVWTKFVLNHRVEPNPRVRHLPPAPQAWTDPSRYLGRVAAAIGVSRRCVALMTAVDLRTLIADREEAGGVWVEGFFTVGVTNAVRAGEPADGPETAGAGCTLGTINIILVTNAHLPDSALVTAVQVATESKTAILLSKGVRSWTGKAGATGTGTDAVVVAAGDGPFLRYSGTHTKIGELIGRLVSRAVLKGIRRARHKMQTRSLPRTG